MTWIPGLSVWDALSLQRFFEKPPLPSSHHPPRRPRHSAAAIPRLACPVPLFWHLTRRVCQCSTTDHRAVRNGRKNPRGENKKKKKRKKKCGGWGFSARRQLHCRRFGRSIARSGCSCCEAADQSPSPPRRDVLLAAYPEARAMATQTEASEASCLLPTQQAPFGEFLFPKHTRKNASVGS